MEKTVILDIKLDTGQSLSDAAKLRDELLALKDAQAANKRETQEQKELYEAQSASIKSVQERINLLTQAVKNQETANKSNSGSFNQLQAAYKVGEASLKALTGTMKRNEDGSIALTKEYFDQKKAVDEAKNALLLFNAGISQGNLNVGNYDNTLTGMRQKLADLEVVIQNTDVGSEKFLEAQKNAEKLKGEIQQVSGQYDSMGNKVAKNPVRDSFNDMQSAAIATTAAIGFVSMAVGTETKAGEALRVVTVALTVAQTALTIARTKDDFIGAKQIITDKIATATKWLYTKSVNAATGALTGFGLALSGLAIGAAVFGLVKLNNIFKEAAKSVDAAKNSLLGYGEALAKTSLSNEKELAQIQNTIDLRKAEGAGLKEIRDLQVDLLNKQEEIRNKKAAQLLIDKAVNKEAIDAAKDEEELNELKAKGNDLEKQSVALINEKYKIINDLKIVDIEYNKAVAESNKKAATEAAEAKKAELDRLSDMMDDYYNRLIDEEQKYRDSLDMTAWEYYQNQLKVIEDAKNQTVKVYDDMGEEIVAVTTGTNDDITDVLLAAIKLRKEAIEADNEAQKEAISALAQDVGQIFADSLTQTGLDLKKFSKGVITLVLDQLEKTLLAAQVEILAKEIATKSFAGIATAAIQIGLITAAFESVKGLINREPKAEFYEGGYTGEGDARSESKALGEKSYTYHRDEYVVPSKVLNDPQGSKLVMQLEKMRVDNPFRIGGIGKADGGFASNFSKSIQTGFRAQDLANVKMVVSVTEINEAQNKIKIKEDTGVL